MKQLILVLTFCLFFFSSVANARDDIQNHSLKDALSTEQAKSKLGTDIKFYFGNQPHEKIIKNFGEFKTNKKTNAFNKTDQAACQWAFLSAMIALKQRAIREGGNAVVNIKSNYKGNLTSSRETFQCGAGKMVAGVALVGKVVTLK